ncbi:cysteine desulfurase family protein [Lysinibacillus sp. NPDC093688]|uniref:cysteine desulfurase family protein n=1 Tax=Lysinibacillus sp. NPDC093688 TaxID=3390577 RepID=UPI003D027C94
MNTIHYFDYNATAPLKNNILEEMKYFLENEFGNPSSNHQLGLNARKAIIKARKNVAAVINSQPENIIFTSGATESNEIAIKGACLKRAKRKGHIITNKIEHSSVHGIIDYLVNHHEYEVSYLPVNEFGVVNVADLDSLIQENTVMICVMYINNETGSIQPIEELGQVSSNLGIHFHCDAVQAFGKVPIDINRMMFDTLTFSSHKLGGPKGIGGLYVRYPQMMEALITSGTQEFGVRAGTENVPAIVGFGELALDLQKEIRHIERHYKALSNYFIGLLSKSLDGWSLNVPSEYVYPSTINMNIEGCNNNALLLALSLQNVCISKGSACASNSKESYVLDAIGLSEEKITSSIRISFGRETLLSDIEYLVITLTREVTKLRTLEV